MNGNLRLVFYFFCKVIVTIFIDCVKVLKEKSAGMTVLLKFVEGTVGYMIDT